MITQKCQAKDPTRCRFHGGHDYAVANKTAATVALTEAYKKVLAGGSTDADEARLVKAQAFYAECEAEVDAFPAEYRKLSSELDFERMKAINDFYGIEGLEYSPKYKELKERQERADAIRSEKFNDASYGLNNIAAEFPISLEETTRLLQEQENGAFVGVIPVAAPTGYKRYKVIGTLGVFTVDERGKVRRPSKIYPVSDPIIPDGFDDLARKYSGDQAEIVGWRTEKGVAFDNYRPMIMGYDLITKTHYVAMDEYKNFISSTPLLSIQ